MKSLSLISICIMSILFISATSQLISTSLRITIRNELGNTVEGAEVQLFTDEDDYREGTNPATEVLKTDAKGVVTFKNLEPIEYFVNAAKDDANNYGAGIQTGKLEPKRINKVTIIIE